MSKVPEKLSSPGDPLTQEGPLGHFLADFTTIELGLSIYDLTTIFKTCYLFTDKSYLYLTKTSADVITVRLKPKQGTEQNLNVLAGEFCNELVNQKTRQIVNSETGKIRELLVAQAFAEANLLEDSTNGDQQAADDYLSDPLNISAHDSL